MTQLLESIRMALAALSANRLRAVLTTSGVVIGIFFVLLMGWVLDGLDRSFTQSFAFFGDDILYIDKYDWSGAGDWRSSWNRRTIDMNQFEEFKRRMRGAEYVVPTTSTMTMNVRKGDLLQNGTMVFGTNYEYISMFSGIMAHGRFISETENTFGSNVVVLGHNIAENLFPNGVQIGEMIRIDGKPFTVIGVMPKRGTMLIDFMDNIVLIPISRFFSMYGSQADVTINVKAGGEERVEEIRDRSMGVMRSVRSISPGEPEDFAINSQEMFSSVVTIIRTVVWGIGLFMTGLAFLVGSIGIMNIMFVSMTERTKEIGIRKAIGAKRSSILTQFLVESVFLCLMGAMIGLILTSLIAGFKEGVVSGIVGMLYRLGIIETRPEIDLSFLSSSIPPAQIVIAVLVAMIVGVMAGIIPAYRAARLDPVDALRAD